MKHLKVHYMNKYPDGRVHAHAELGLDVYDAQGNHRVSLIKNGAGQWVDQSAEMGCVDRHDLSPIPKNARFMKLYPDGRIGKAEEHDSRKPIAQSLAASSVGGVGKVPSIAELNPKMNFSVADPTNLSNWEVPTTTQAPQASPAPAAAPTVGNA